MVEVEIILQTHLILLKLKENLIRELQNKENFKFD